MRWLLLYRVYLCHALQAIGYANGSSGFKQLRQAEPKTRHRLGPLTLQAKEFSQTKRRQAEVDCFLPAGQQHPTSFESFGRLRKIAFVRVDTGQMSQDKPFEPAIRVMLVCAERDQAFFELLTRAGEIAGFEGN